ncbi:inorganic pyrophosphatase [Neurospora tetraspora]|uniref:inorganic diphosphatase n=1 Tax=Neurospora tetraspora TaxID=94610 RepID=A0AAE0JG14_9PEZI|nr:inorganic pyrophosphatase [Neurospora tetraspora]
MASLHQTPFPQHHGGKHHGNHHDKAEDNDSNHNNDSDTENNYTLTKSDRPYTLSHKIHFLRKSPCDGKRIPISPFHDIPLFHSKPHGIYNMIVEIPRWSQAKFEISRSLPLNPISQDTLSSHPSRPRFVHNLFPYKGYIWNYGCLPQTWESPHHSHRDTPGHKGDNDPIDACEIGSRVAYTGEVKQVKVLGILGLLDEGETDWKVLVVDVRDKLAGRLDDVEDVRRECPGLLEATRDWFRWYGVPEGRKRNRYAMGGRWMGRGYAEGVIKECEGFWRKLVRGEVEGSEDICLKNTTLDGTPGKCDPSSVKLPPNEDLPPAEVEQDLDEVAYVDREKRDDDEDEGDDKEDSMTNDYRKDNLTNDDEEKNLMNDITLNNLKTLNINLTFW